MFLSYAYSFLTDLGAPGIYMYLLRRRAQGREDRERFAERFGEASHARPRGKLIWCHAASLGEAASLLTLIRKLREHYPATSILVTTGTVTSAAMLKNRLPPGAIHQYVPVDRANYVRHFLNHWQPDMALWIESELWPNMLTSLRRRGIPAILLNARMSEKSFRNWQKVKTWTRYLLGAFALCLTQTEDEKARFAALGATQARCVGNLKYAAEPLPYNEAALAPLRTAIGARPCWLMVSTHKGEEEMALAAHKELQAKYPNLLTIIVPRHAVRGGEVAHLIEQSGLRMARRSSGDEIMPDTSVYLADTMGEMGMFYRLSCIVCLGGSFVPVGGHNPIEPAQLGCAILFGPHLHNFREVTEEFLKKQAAISLPDSGAIASAVGQLLAVPSEAERLARAASAVAEAKRNVLGLVLEEIQPWLLKSGVSV